MTMPTPALSRARSFGWWSLLLWLSLGLVLEAMHGFKVRWYLDVANDARRLMLTLAHAHGTMIALVNLAFAATVAARPEHHAALSRAGTCLRWAGILLPVGFFAGGVQILGADPGFGIVLVPIGAVFLIYGVAVAARLVGTAEPEPPAPPPPPPPARPKQ
jgi:hypothetical protein